MFEIRVLLCVLLFTGFASSQTQPSAPTCASTEFLMTPAFRGQVLDYINDARNTLKNGQLILENGEHALIPETMPELTWDCDLEEEMRTLAKQACITNIPPIGNYTWFSSRMNTPHAEVVYGGVHYPDIIGHYANDLSQHTIYTGAVPMNFISALHDKAETIGCALYDCFINNNQLPGVPSSYTLSYLICKITPDVQFGEKIYEVAPGQVTDFPSEDVICPGTFQIDIDMREMILEKINVVRQQIQEGTYQLENEKNALQAVNLPNLIWDCEEESNVFWEGTPYGSNCVEYTDQETVFQTFVPIDWATHTSHSLSNGISTTLDQLFISNPNFNFLLQSTTYSTPYPPALALSEQATHIACAASICTDPNTSSQNYNFACRVKPATPINQLLYQHV